MSQRNTLSRGGVTLTELLLLMSACTMILSTSAMLLHRVMRVQIDSRHFADAERSTARLSRQFRQDVHCATSAGLDASKLKKDVFLQLQLPQNATVEYSRVNGNVLRTAAIAGKVSSREEFAFQPSCNLDVREDKSPNRIVLSMTSPALEPTSTGEVQLKSYRATPVGLYVEAVLNRSVSPLSSTAESEPAK